MRIRNQILQGLPFLCILTLPITSALPSGGDAYVGKDVSASSVESPGETNTPSGSWVSALDPTHLFKGIQIKESEEKLQEYVHGLLEAAQTQFKSTKFTDVTSAMHHIVEATATFRDNITGTLDAHNTTLGMLTEELQGIFMGIVKNLETIPPPDSDDAPGHAKRASVVGKILDDTAQALTALATRYGIEEEAVTTYLLALRPQVEALMVAVGDINKQHPELLPILIFSVVTLLIPESWILRPFLELFGFGPAGPIKGSIAAWMQSYFWGAAVEPGSWFALLQAAGMGTLPEWAGFALKVPLLGGLLSALSPSLKHG